MHVSKGYKHFSRVIRLVFATVIVALMTISCAEKMICPAYQSAFIFDTTALKKKFSYFVNDTPRIHVVSKNKFLLIEPISYRKQMASFRTIEMLPIYPVIPDSLRFQADNILLGDLDIKDSTGQTPLHPGLIGVKFNVEQENYMYYFRKVLVLPDVRAGASSAKAKKKKKGFFKRIFGKKGDEPVDAAARGEEPAEKKGFFKRVFGKKSDEPVDALAPGEEPAEKARVFQTSV